jgi:hypothetical protein
LQVLAELPVSAKQVERLTRRIGEERVHQRDSAVTAFAALPLAEKFQAPDGVKPPDLAVVFVDGGRLQVRERGLRKATASEAETQAELALWDEESDKRKGFWREDKIGTLVEMKSAVHEADPCPDLPSGFVDAKRIPQLVRELGKTAARTEGEGDEVVAPLPGEEGPARERVYEPPEVEHRRVVASCQAWPVLAVVVAQAGHAAGFSKAKRRAFVADGSANNWRLRERFFGSFVAVLDFIHALSYVYGAATAGRGAEEGWSCYREWISLVWKGRVSKVIEALGKRQEEVGKSEEGDSETSVRVVVGRALGYLRNHADKMKYDEYRKEGLPITSSLMESVVKQMNQRVKGSEKFWCGEGAEAIVQLRADHLSDDQPLEAFWKNRQATAAGQRFYRHAA